MIIYIFAVSCMWSLFSLFNKQKPKNLIYESWFLARQIEQAPVFMHGADLCLSLVISCLSLTSSYLPSDTPSPVVPSLDPAFSIGPACAPSAPAELYISDEALPSFVQHPLQHQYLRNFWFLIVQLFKVCKCRLEFLILFPCGQFITVSFNCFSVWETPKLSLDLSLSFSLRSIWCCISPLASASFVDFPSLERPEDSILIFCSFPGPLSFADTLRIAVWHQYQKSTSIWGTRRWKVEYQKVGNLPIALLSLKP